MIQKNRRLQPFAGLIRTSMILFTAIAIAFLTMSSASFAEVSDYTISPESPGPGDVVTISGQADPKEDVTVYITFEAVTAVSNGEYTYEIEDVDIPEGSEHFSVSAQEVNDLEIEVRIPYTPLYVSVPDRFVTVNNGVASFGTSEFAEYGFGKYDIRLTGTSSEDKVTISFGARGSITSDSSGNFEYTYDASNMPEGVYTITIGGIKKQINFGGDDSTGTSSSGRSGSSHTGTEFKIVPADSLGSDDDGTGEDSTSDDGSLASTQDSPEITDDTEYVEGSKMEQQTSTESTSNYPVKIIGVVIVALGLIGLGAVMYRKKIK